MIKSKHELQLMKLANEVTLAAYEAAYLSTKEGMTQNDFGSMVQAAHAQQGFEGVQAYKWVRIPLYHTDQPSRRSFAREQSC